MRKFASLLFLLSPFTGFSAQVFQTAYINRGNIVTVKNTVFPSLALNESTSFNALNKVYLLTTSDTLTVKLINNDTAIHSIAVQGGSSYADIAAGDSLNITLSFSNEGNYIYYDQKSIPTNRYLGLSGMICVSNSPRAKYFWNLKEHQSSFNDQLAQGGSVNWNNYYPDYFTINGKSFPELQIDSTAKINAQVGDTVLIFVANTGMSMHSLHFHGFHPRCIYSSNGNKLLNWSKDTFPLKSMESLVLVLVPDKPGRYSVHDHNLVAVTAGGTHPNGMFTIMEIQ